MRACEDYLAEERGLEPKSLGGVLITPAGSCGEAKFGAGPLAFAGARRVMQADEVHAEIVCGIVAEGPDNAKIRWQTKHLTDYIQSVYSTE